MDIVGRCWVARNMSGCIIIILVIVERCDGRDVGGYRVGGSCSDGFIKVEAPHSGSVRLA